MRPYYTVTTTNYKTGASREIIRTTRKAEAVKAALNCKGGAQIATALIWHTQNGEIHLTKDGRPTHGSH